MDVEIQWVQQSRPIMTRAVGLGKRRKGNGIDIHALCGALQLFSCGCAYCQQHRNLQRKAEKKKNVLSIHIAA